MYNNFYFQDDYLHSVNGTIDWVEDYDSHVYLSISLKCEDPFHNITIQQQTRIFEKDEGNYKTEFLDIFDDLLLKDSDGYYTAEHLKSSDIQFIFEEVFDSITCSYSSKLLDCYPTHSVDWDYLKEGWN